MCQICSGRVLPVSQIRARPLEGRPSRASQLSCRRYGCHLQFLCHNAGRSPARNCLLDKTLVPTGRHADRLGIAPVRSAGQFGTRLLTPSPAPWVACCATGSAVSAPSSSNFLEEVKELVYECSWLWAVVVLAAQFFAGTTLATAHVPGPQSTFSAKLKLKSRTRNL